MITRREFLQNTALGVGATLGPLTLRQDAQKPVVVNPNPGPVPIGQRPGIVNPVVGIVLAGGGAKGSFEVGAVRYLYDQGIRPNIICGTSVGAINAIKLAEGEGGPNQGLADLENIWLGLNQNEDMYREGEWLNWLRTNKPDVYGLIQSSFLAPTEAEVPPATLVVGVTDLSPIVQIAGGILLGTPLFPAGLAILLGYNLLKGLVDGVIECRDLQDTIMSFEQKKPKGLYDLSPIQNILQARLDLGLVQKWVTAGGKLRLATVALESGKLRYVTETGQLLDRDNSAVVYQFPLQNNPPTGAPDLRPGVMASAAIPTFFMPVELGGETYVDGGIRDVMPVTTAIKLGANVIYAINDSKPLSRSNDSYLDQTLLDIAERSLLGIALDEVVHESSTGFGNAQQVSINLIQCTYTQDMDTFQIHPALIRMNMSYGYMRAADTVNPVGTCAERCYQITDDITNLRRILFEFEKRVIYGLNATQPGSADTRISVPMLRWGKGMLSLLVKEREMLGGVIPKEVYESCWSWEKHIPSVQRYIPGPTPFQAVPPVPADINVADFIPSDKTLLREENAPFISWSVPPWLQTYIILGGAKFLIPSLQEALALGFPPFPSFQTVPTKSIACLASVPWEGTLIRERGSRAVYVIQNCAKRFIINPTVFNNHHFNLASVLTAPTGSLASIPNGPDLTS